MQKKSFFVNATACAHVLVCVCVCVCTFRFVNTGRDNDRSGRQCCRGDSDCFNLLQVNNRNIY